MNNAASSYIYSEMTVQAGMPYYFNDIPRTSTLGARTEIKSALGIIISAENCGKEPADCTDRTACDSSDNSARSPEYPYTDLHTFIRTS